MPVAVRFSPRGLRDLFACSAWWTTHHPNDANHFDDELKRALDFIKQFPEGAPRGGARGYRTARVRVMAETGHLLLYRVRSKKVVEVVAVLASKATATRP